MPLKKLWNALRGSSAGASQTKARDERSPTSSAQPAAAGDAQDATKHASGSPGASDHAVKSPKAKSSAGSSSAAAATTKRRVPSREKATSSSIRLAGSTADTSAIDSPPAPASRRDSRRAISVRKTSLTKSLRKEAANLCGDKVLWLGVSECSVGPEAIQFLSGRSQAESADPGKTRLIVVEQFESGDGPVSLMHFHRELRGHDIRPMMFPEAPTDAIARVGRTVGGVDLVLIERGPWDVEIERALGRITSPQTCVMRLENGQWRRLRIAATALPAAA